MGCEILLTDRINMEYIPHVALTFGEDSASALEGSTPVRAYKKELLAAPFLFWTRLTLPSTTGAAEMPDSIAQASHNSLFTNGRSVSLKIAREGE